MVVFSEAAYVTVSSANALFPESTSKTLIVSNV